MIAILRCYMIIGDMNWCIRECFAFRWGMMNADSQDERSWGDVHEKVLAFTATQILALQFSP